MKFLIEGKTYRMRTADELVLADWHAINGEPFPPDQSDMVEHLVGIISRVTTVPKIKLRKVRMADLEQAVESITQVLERAVKAQQATAPDAFEFEGVIYTVPRNLEDLEYERWHTFTSALNGVDKEVDAFALSLACLCQGPTEFDGVEVGALADKFKRLPMFTALTVCAFFFASSERWRIVMLGWCLKQVMSGLLLPEQWQGQNAMA